MKHKNQIINQDQNLTGLLLRRGINFDELLRHTTLDLDRIFNSKKIEKKAKVSSETVDNNNIASDFDIIETDGKFSCKVIKADRTWEALMLSEKSAWAWILMMLDQS